LGRELLLTSVEDGATLRMTCPDQSWGSITVEAAGSDFSVSAPVYVDLAPSLPDFLNEVASAAPSSDKPLHWETIEGEFRLETRRDTVGHIFVTYHLRSPDIGSNRWWTFTGRLVLELGAMPDICKRAGRFWNAAT
jgi:Family of unknown function (DUF6228)